MSYSVRKAYVQRAFFHNSLSVWYMVRINTACDDGDVPHSLVSYKSAVFRIQSRCLCTQRKAFHMSIA